MFGNFQQSHIRIELSATAQAIGQQLGYGDSLARLLLPNNLPLLTDRQPLQVGDRITATWGWLKLEQQVSQVGDRSLRLLLHGSIDGYQEWSWGDGWVQSGTAGVSVLPLTALQTWQLIQLQQGLGDLKGNHHQSQQQETPDRSNQ